MNQKRRIKNAFSVDVEDYFQVSAFEHSVNRDSWQSMESRVVANTQAVLDILAEFDVRGTFFVLGWVGERYPKLVAQVADAGHEVACHGYSHRRIYQQRVKEFREETHKAKRILEDACGQAVIGYRAASFSITRESYWALDILKSEGFAYDSSIFPVRHDKYGIADASPDPGRIKTASGDELIEFPMNSIGWRSMRFPIGGGGYFRLYPYGLTRFGLNLINSRNKRAIFYMHPWEVDPGQPRVAASGLSKFRHYNNLEKFESRLRRLLADFDFDTCQAVLADLKLLEPRDQPAD